LEAAGGRVCPVYHPDVPLTPCPPARVSSLGALEVSIKFSVPLRVRVNTFKFIKVKVKENRSEIYISSNPFETRVARIEAGRLVEFYVERAKDRGITGNIYKGRVVRVLPGMQSAFTEIGLARTAFLHVSDIKESLGDVEEEDERDEGGRQRGGGGGPTKIQDMLKEGQEIMVQAAKEPIGTKGARITSYISLPGRYLVFMPTYEKVAVSRRISSDKERRRLKETVQKLRPQGSGYGFIIRTVCEGMGRDEIKADMDFLMKLWQRILENREKVPTPGLLYEELDLTFRTIRDIFSVDVDRLVIDSKEEHERAVKFVTEFMPHLSGRVELFSEPADIFDAHGIEIELGGALERKVWLRSGGHIVIDQMEALTAIDVNTGKYVGKKSSDQTILKTNLEAVHETVYQLRLRNIGGIIVIDFIDMARIGDREKVYNELKEALRIDKARTNILKISELGIVEMTRKRVRESIAQALCAPCPYCDGNGLVKGVDTIIMDIYRELLRDLPQKKRKAVVYVSPAVAERFASEEAIVRDLEQRFGKKVVIKPVERFHQERYEIF
jgi:ribonuclease G